MIEKDIDNNINSDGIPIIITHHGFNVKCWRGIRGMKQPELAELIGVSNPTMVNIEKKEVIDEETLQKIAKALNTTVDNIKNLNKNSVISVHNFYDNAANNINPTTNNTTNNGVSFEEYKALFERLLIAETELAKFKNNKS